MQRAHVVLPKVESMNNAYVEVTAGGEVAFASPDSPGAGIFRVRPGACSGPSFVIVDYSVELGHIYAALFSANLAHQIGTANPTAAEEGKIYLEPGAVHTRGCGLADRIARTGTKGRVRKISVIAVRQMSRSEYKHYRSWSFPHWYYSCELGDGIPRDGPRSRTRRPSCPRLSVRGAKHPHDGAACRRSIGCKYSRRRLLGRLPDDGVRQARRGRYWNRLGPERNRAGGVRARLRCRAT